jgi:putative SOS response-associated peptidase YedK
MCGRFSLSLPIPGLLEFLEVAWDDFTPRFNIAPTQEISIVRLDPEGRKELTPVQWGLVPAWAEAPPKSPLINARCETVRAKPSFRDAFRQRRCLIPATGFFEWLKKESRKRLPYHITYRDGSPMLFAGIWDRWKDPEDPERTIESCAIITCDACPEIEPLHDRMPVLIPKGSSELWLYGDPESAASLMVPCPGRDLLLTPANPVMNSGAVEGPECLQVGQGELF